MMWKYLSGGLLVVCGCLVAIIVMTVCMWCGAKFWERG